jgi:paraquat-inducible protein B
MKKSSTLILPSFISAVVLLFTGCGSSPSSIIEELIDVSNEITETLKGIESKEDYEDVEDDLKELGKKMGELKDQMDEMENELSDEEKDELEEEYEDELKKSMLDMMSAAMKVAQYGVNISDIN